jgi:Tn3 transposase DDE domain
LLNLGSLSNEFIQMNDAQYRRIVEHARRLAFANATRSRLKPKEVLTQPKRNALARAVLFNRLGEIRDRSFEQQRYRASGWNLITAAIVLWNTVYLERAIAAMNRHRRLAGQKAKEYKWII